MHEWRTSERSGHRSPVVAIPGTRNPRNPRAIRAIRDTRNPGHTSFSRRPALLGPGPVWDTGPGCDTHQWHAPGSPAPVLRQPRGSPEANPINGLACSRARSPRMIIWNTGSPRQRWARAGVSASAIQRLGVPPWMPASRFTGSPSCMAWRTGIRDRIREDRIRDTHDSRSIRYRSVTRRSVRACPRLALDWCGWCSSTGVVHIWPIWGPRTPLAKSRAGWLANGRP
jgi:hypothetical protein